MEIKVTEVVSKTKKTAVAKKKDVKAPSAPVKTIIVTRTGSDIGCVSAVRGTLIGLGLRKRHQTRELEDTDAVRGMIRRVQHLVEVKE